MTIYKNTNGKAVVSSVEIVGADQPAFFFVKNERDVAQAEKLLANGGQSVLARSQVAGQTVLIASGQGNQAQLFKMLAASDGSAFEPLKPSSPTFLQSLRRNGWKIRGGSSVIGQSMTLFSAFNSVSKVDAQAGKLKPRFDPATGAFATLNLAANVINFTCGGQKEKDLAGLEKFDALIAEEISSYLPNENFEPDVDSKLAYMSKAELVKHEKSNGALGLLKQNSSSVGEVGLRTAGSLCMMFDYKKILPGLKELFKGNVKQAFLTAKVADRNTFLAGCGMVAGKTMGLLAQTYDPNNPPKTYMAEIRQNVLWKVSSVTEMIAQSSVAVDKHKNKRLVLGGKAHYDYTGVAGNALLTVPPYPTRLVLPYGEKVLDVQEVQARLIEKLAKLPPDKIPEVAARVTARMVEHMGEKSPSFGELYKTILQKLDKFHQVKVILTPAEKPQQTTQIAVHAGHSAKAGMHSKRDVAKAGDGVDAIKNIIARHAEPNAAVAMQLG